MRKIGVLVVTYNQKDLTLNWINEFKRTFLGQDNLYLLILDNNSNDGTYEALKKQYPDEDVRKLNDNYGCNTGRNIGIVELINMGCEYICTLDNDCIIEDSQFFRKMQEAFDSNRDIDGYSAIVKWGDDRSIDTMGSRRKWYGIRRAVKIITKNTKVDYFSGGACVIRACTYIKYGLLDNDYPLVGGEDHAWGLRVTKDGANLHFNPQTEIFHYQNRHIPSSNPEKITCCIHGKVMFLRKNPSLVYLLLEVRDCCHYLSRYGFRLCLKSYYTGLKRKMHQNNYKFKEFSEQGLQKYYAQTQVVTH